ncbi:LysR substrate-binding domain-containing protein [Micropruina sp.]|uniref:LysR substrate-binding domain-containing protein n=1 Tax=Micropruina sp. TaxID=2737536 RepID=UPI0039E2FA11
METRRLATFVRIVDVGSLTRAADVLHIAQPALSQQINALEADLGQQLLIRSKQGVEPTEAGAALYRHAQVILKQLDDAVAEVGLLGREVAGQVFVGLAPYSTANLIALPLVEAVRARYPHILLRVVDNFGLVLSEAMMTGRLHLAILYDSGPVKGLVFERLITEELVLVCAADAPVVGDEVPIEALTELPLMLPSPLHTIRKAINLAFDAAGIQPEVLAELESVGLMGQAVSAGLCATVLPRSVADRLTNGPALRQIRIAPGIEVHLSLGTPSSLPLSRAAECVRDLLRHVVAATLLDAQ